MFDDMLDALKVWAAYNARWLIACGVALVAGFLLRGCF